MPMSKKEKTDYKRRFNEENYDRVSVYLKEGEKEAWKKKAAESGEKSLGNYIKKCVEGKMRKYYVRTEIGAVNSMSGCIVAPGSTAVLAPFYGETLQEAVDGNVDLLIKLVKSSNETVLSHSDHAEITVREEEVIDGLGRKKILKHISADIMCHVNNGHSPDSPKYREYDKIYTIYISEG